MSQLIVEDPIMQPTAVSSNSCDDRTYQAAIYARTNGSKPADDEHSLAKQIERCQQFAFQKSFTVAGIYQNEISGITPIAVRPEGRKLEQAIRHGLFQVVIVDQIDRLSRNIVDLVITIQDWLQVGVKIYVLNQGELTSNFKTIGMFVDQTCQDKDDE